MPAIIGPTRGATPRLYPRPTAAKKTLCNFGSPYLKLTIDVREYNYRGPSRKLLKRVRNYSTAIKSSHNLRTEAQDEGQKNR